MPKNDNHGLNHRSINETSNECGGGEANKWAFNDAPDPQRVRESEREEITIIKHLIFLMSDCLHPSLPVSTCTLLLSLRSASQVALPHPLYFLPLRPSSLLYPCLVLCVWRTKKDAVRWAMRGLLRVSVIFGCDISIPGLNVWCQPIYYPLTGERKPADRKQATENDGVIWKRAEKGHSQRPISVVQ